MLSLYIHSVFKEAEGREESVHVLVCYINLPITTSGSPHYFQWIQVT